MYIFYKKSIQQVEQLVNMVFGSMSKTGSSFHQHYYFILLQEYFIRAHYSVLENTYSII